MNKSVTFLLITIIFLLGCKQNVNTVISNFEYNSNSIIIKQIKLKNGFYPFFAKDSIDILNMEYNTFYKKKLELLNKQLAELTQKYNDANSELKTIKNPLMKNAYGSRVKIMQEDKNRIEKIIFIYKNYPEQTMLKRIEQKKLIYKNMMADSILGYTIKITFAGKQGNLSLKVFESEYFFNRDKNKIIKKIANCF